MLEVDDLGAIAKGLVFLLASAGSLLSGFATKTCRLSSGRSAELIVSTWNESSPRHST